MISAHAFFSETLATVDAVIGNFVNKAYVHFIQANSGVITLLFTLYVMLMGYRFLTHTQKMDMGAILRHLIVMVCVYGLVMNWKLYHLFIYRIFTIEPGIVAQILVDAARDAQSNVTISQALDEIYETIINTSMNFFSQMTFAGGISFLFYGVLVFLIGAIMCIFALLLFIYAKMMMAVALALGPIFILFLLFDTTKDMFAAWLRKLITIALIPIVTSAILVLMLSVIQVTLPNIQQPPENLQFYGIAPFLGLSVATALILSQVFRISSSLGGGLTLTSISQGADIAKASLEKSGITPAGRRMVGWSQKKIKQVRYRNEQK